MTVIDGPITPGDLNLRVGRAPDGSPHTFTPDGPPYALPAGGRFVAHDDGGPPWTRDQVLELGRILLTVATGRGALGALAAMAQLGAREEIGMRWIRCQVNGTLGTLESFTHVLNLTVHGGGAANLETITPTQVQAVAEMVRVRFEAFLKDTNKAPLNYLPSDVKYVDVAAALVERTQPTSKTDPNAGKVSTLIESQYAFWTTPLAGTSTQGALPYQLSLVLSLRTRQRGTRNRGRLYLPPMSMAGLAGSGGLPTTSAKAVGEAFGRQFVEWIRANSDYQLSVVSGRGNYENEVVKIDVGSVFDTQRRRRENLQELATTLWTSPTI